MARVKGIGDALKPHTEVPAESAAVDQAPPPPVNGESMAPAQPSAEHVDQADDGPADQAAPAAETKTPAKSAQPRTAGRGQGGSRAPRAAGTSTPPAPAAPEIEVLATDTASGKKITVYLHPDDYRELGMARLDDSADFNARIRAMIAVWRHDPRFRRKVDKLARTAPRGGMR